PACSGYAISPENVIPRGSGHIGKRTIRFYLPHPRFKIRQPDQAVGRAKSWFILTFYLVIAIYYGKLKIGGYPTRAVLHPDQTIIILSNPPLPPWSAGRFLDYALRCPPDATGVVRTVHPVVQGPGEKTGLVFYIP